MALKGKKRKAVVAEEKTKDSLPATVGLQDDRPETSQYTQPAFQLRIGSRDYTVPKFLLANYPKIPAPSPYSFERTIDLPQVNDDIGHTLVNYLYWGTYETLRPQVATDLTGSEIEYRRGVLTYYTARLYDIEGLVNHALDTIGRFGEHLSIAQILDGVCDVYAKLPEDETWLPEYLKTQLEIAFSLDEYLFSCEGFLKHIGKNANFSRALVKIMGNIYVGKLSSATKAQESGQYAAKQFEEEVPPEEETPPAEELTPEVPPEQFSLDDDHIWGTWGSKDTKEEERPVDVDISVLEGLTCEKDGKLLGCNGVAIGELYEGDATIIARRLYMCSEKGEFKDKKSKVVGKARVLPKPENQPETEPEVDEKVAEPELLTLASSEGLAIDRSSGVYNNDGFLVEIGRSKPPLPESESIEDPDVCLEQMQHMRKGGIWRTCRKCRELICRRSIQLMHDGVMIEEGAAT